MLPPPGVTPSGLAILSTLSSSTSSAALASATLSTVAFAIATIIPTSAPPSTTTGSALPLGVSSIPSAALSLAASLASASAATAATATGFPAAAYDDGSPPPRNGECQLLGPFALIVQAALGVLALLALVFKRWRERPQRPLNVWFFDVSKQVVGSVLVHVANLFMSMLSSGQFSIKLEPTSIHARKAAMMMLLLGRGGDGKAGKGGYQPNPCSFYLLNLAIDTTLGIPILIIFLRVYTGLFAMTPFGQPRESIQSGHYGSPPRAKWWAKQSLIYFLGLLGMKVCVLIIFLALPWISRVGDWALRWTEGNEELQVFFVMLFFPVVMNATQYYIIDGFIKDQKPQAAEGEEGLGADDDEEGEGGGGGNGGRERAPGGTGPFEEEEDEGLLSGGSGDGGEAAERRRKNQATAKNGDRTKQKSKISTVAVEKDGPDSPVARRGRHEYDPARDGEQQESGDTMGSGSGSNDGGVAS